MTRIMVLRVGRKRYSRYVERGSISGSGMSSSFGHCWIGGPDKCFILNENITEVHIFYVIIFSINNLHKSTPRCYISLWMMMWSRWGFSKFLNVLFQNSVGEYLIYIHLTCGRGEMWLCHRLVDANFYQIFFIEFCLLL